VGLLLQADPNPDSCPLALEVLGRFLAITPHILLSGTPADAERLARQGVELEVIALAPLPRPRFLQPLVRERCVGRGQQATQIVDLVRAGRHVIVTGPPGVGKTTLCRSLAAQTGLRDLELYEISVVDLMGSTEFRGSLEARIRDLLTFVESSPQPPIIVMDEMLRLAQRTGRDDQVCLDSFLDLIRSELSAPKPDFIAIGTATDVEFSQILRFDPAMARRFTEVRLQPLDRQDLQQAMELWARDIDVHLSAGDRACILDSAPQLLPRESSPAREIKLLHWCRASRGGAIHAALRERFGELVAPRRGRLLERIRQLRGDVRGRDHEIALLAEGMDVAIQRLVTGDRSVEGPLLGIVISGPRGSGKRHLAHSVVRAVGTSHCSVVGPDRIAGHVRANRGNPGGAVIVLGDALEGPGGCAEIITADPHWPVVSLPQIFQQVRPLHRWLVILALHTSDDLDDGEQAGPFPTVWLPVTPIRLKRTQARELAELMVQTLRRRIRTCGVSEQVRSLTLAEIHDCCHGRPTPNQLERRIIERLVGETPESAATVGPERVVVPFEM